MNGELDPIIVKPALPEGAQQITSNFTDPYHEDKPTIVYSVDSNGSRQLYVLAADGHSYPIKLEDVEANPGYQNATKEACQTFLVGEF